MSGATSQPQERALDGGDRVRIGQGLGPPLAVIGRKGTVVEVFQIPRDSCLVRVDDDPDPRREWFCYRNEVTLLAGEE